MSGTVLFEHRLPLAWSVLATGEVGVSPEQNQLIFALLDSSDEIVQHHQDKEKAADLQRLETKLNVIMHLLGMLMQGQQKYPPDTVIRFSSDSLAWQAESPLQAGSLLSISLYPEDGVPLAMRFTATVLSFADGWLTVDLHGLNEDERAIWSRWVFRHHRRQVALQRAHSLSK